MGLSPQIINNPINLFPQGINKIKNYKLVAVFRKKGKIIN